MLVHLKLTGRLKGNFTDFQPALHHYNVVAPRPPRYFCPPRDVFHKIGQSSRENWVQATWRKGKDHLHILPTLS